MYTEPSILFWHPLVEYYPKMKVILTIRDANKWYKSYYNAICKTITNPVLLWVGRRLKHFIPFANRYFEVFKYELIVTFNYKKNGGSNTFDREYAINGFNQRNNQIIKYFKENDEMDRFMIVDWDRKDKNKMFLELMDFLDIKLSKEELELRSKENNGNYFT